MRPTVWVSEKRFPEGYCNSANILPSQLPTRCGGPARAWQVEVKNRRVDRRSLPPDRPGGARLGRQRYFEFTSRRKLPISNAPKDLRHGPVVYVGIANVEACQKPR